MDSMPQFFAILSPARCRSNYLVALLQSHPNVTCHSEIFHQHQVILSLPDLPKEHSLFNIKWRNNYSHLFVSNLIRQTKNYFPEKNSIGCKLLLYHQQMVKGLEPILEHKPLVILLSRSNKLAWYSSVKIAMDTGVWMIKEKAEEQHKITFDAENYFQTMHHQNICEQHTLQRLKEHKINYIHVEYNELINPAGISRILQFLSLPAADLSSYTYPQNSKNILERFNNPEEVKKFAASMGNCDWLE